MGIEVALTSSVLAHSAYRKLLCLPHTYLDLLTLTTQENQHTPQQTTSVAALSIQKVISGIEHTAVLTGIPRYHIVMD